ncbi:septal ring lytic transglycosylase RlpA family protein [Porifericola rhodea]|uniref:septal ring lytic transglycosylase RlpA family protein n=1 Tax=Porifericola rhodea TaxID=930972 RepID=UPI00266677DE|nr:septal ring lytic transglycosylase RlpA family protein [Porifericola rhodea]WKN29600.1 septal ring lytic transglycosylase RlpA family protein [Porifericola rhodea]
MNILLIPFFLILQACQTGEAFNFEQQGQASYYANALAGQTTANGETYHPDSLTAAHRHLPLGTEILVINPENQIQIRLKVNDRGPYHGRRILDVSRRAADSLGLIQDGVAEVIIKASLPQEIADSLNQELNSTSGNVKQAK